MADAQAAPASSEANLLREGLAAIARGWAVTPLAGKVPILPKWQKAPMPTEGDVRRWVRAGYNLGLRTGPVSGVIVLDHDPRNDDGTSLPVLPTTVTVRTGGGGTHHLFRCPASPPPNSTGRIHPALDVKSAGGQVVLAGSVHPDTGATYVSAQGLDPDSAPLADVPTELLAMMHEREPGSAPQRPLPKGPLPDHAVRMAWALTWLSNVPVAISGRGGHNHTFYVACRLALGFDLDKDTTLALLSKWNQACEPPWSERELLHKVTDAHKQPGPRGYLLVTSQVHPPPSVAEVPDWAVVALSAQRTERIVLPRRVSRRVIRLLSEGWHAKYARANGTLDGSRAVLATAMSLLAASLPEPEVANAIAASALRPVLDVHGADAPRWLARKIEAARRALGKSPA